MPERKIYPTERPDVELRELITEDADPFHATLTDSREHLSYSDLTIVRDYPTPEDVRRSITDPIDPSRLRLGIWSENDFLGSINVAPRAGSRAEIGYWVAAAHLRKGYGSVALRALALQSPRYITPYLRIHRDNTPSIATAESSHFRFSHEEGTTKIYTYVRPRSLGNLDQPGKSY